MNLSPTSSAASAAVPPLQERLSLAQRIAAADDLWRDYVSTRCVIARTGAAITGEACVLALVPFIRLLSEREDLRALALGFVRLDFAKTIIADKAWGTFAQAVRESAARPTPISGASRLIAFKSFIDALFDDESFRRAMEEDFVVRLRDEGPREQGKLL